MGSSLPAQTAALVLLLVEQIPLLGFTNGRELQGAQDMSPLVAPEAVIAVCPPYPVKNFFSNSSSPLTISVLLVYHPHHFFFYL